VVSEIVGAIAKVRDCLDPVLLRGGIGVPGFIDIDTGVIIGSELIGATAAHLAINGYWLRQITAPGVPRARPA